MRYLIICYYILYKSSLSFGNTCGVLLKNKDKIWGSNKIYAVCLPVVIYFVSYCKIFLMRLFPFNFCRFPFVFITSKPAKTSRESMIWVLMPSRRWRVTKSKWLRPCSRPKGQRKTHWASLATAQPYSTPWSSSNHLRRPSSGISRMICRKTRRTPIWLLVSASIARRHFMRKRRRFSWATRRATLGQRSRWSFSVFYKKWWELYSVLSWKIVGCRVFFDSIPRIPASRFGVEF